jgi:hypothetical protein
MTKGDSGFPRLRLEKDKKELGVGWERDCHVAHAPRNDKRGILSGSPLLKKEKPHRRGWGFSVKAKSEKV